MPDVFDGDTFAPSNLSETFTVKEDLFGGTTINGGGGTDTLDADGAWTIDDAVVISGIENLALDGDLLTLSVSDLASFSDIEASGTATNGFVALTPGGGASFASLDVRQLSGLDVEGSIVGETLFFTTPQGSPPTDMRVRGNEGDDVLDTGDGDDTIEGNENEDTLDGNGGADRLFGGNGDDTLIVRSGDIVIRGGNDDDTFLISEGSIDPHATEGTVIAGGAGTDTLKGAAAGTSWGIDPLVTIQGIEELALDLDQIAMSASQLETFTTITRDGFATSGELGLTRGGTATTDVTGLNSLTVEVGDFFNVYQLTFTTSGATKTDITVEGALAFDRLITGDGDDTLRGYDGDDRLKGNAGIDELDGGADDDRLTGGADSDFFVFSGSFGHDTVTDFENVLDRFDMDASLSFASLTVTALDADADGAADDARVAAGADWFDVLDTATTTIDASDFVF